jgi:hypothetical protein
MYVISFAKTFLDNILFVTPSFQIIFKLTQSFSQRFVGGANSPDSIFDQETPCFTSGRY